MNNAFLLGVKKDRDTELKKNIEKIKAVLKIKNLQGEQLKSLCLVFTKICAVFLSSQCSFYTLQLCLIVRIYNPLLS